MIDLFQELPQIPKDKLHPKFCLLRDSLTMDGERKIITSWTEGFIDRDNKIVEEFQKTFHSAFWEFYLHHLFMERGFTIDYSKNRPDFIITDPVRMAVEAVVSNIKQDGRDESTRNEWDLFGNLTPPHQQNDFVENMNEAITRYSNAIHTKVKKLNTEYLKLDWVEKGTPFVIALSSYSQVNYGREFYYPMFALLYGLYFDPHRKEYLPQDFILKPGSNAQIKLGLFDEPEMEEVSAIIFSCTVTLGKLTSLSKSSNNSELNFNTVLLIREESKPPHYWFQEVSEESPELHSDGLFVFHNPKAKVKLPFEMFSDSCALQVISDGGDYLQVLGHREPIYSRFNLPSLLLPFEVKKAIIEETFERFNNP
jgi:hypothetical protein